MRMEALAARRLLETHRRRALLIQTRLDNAKAALAGTWSAAIVGSRQRWHQTCNSLAHLGQRIVATRIHGESLDAGRIRRVWRLHVGSDREFFLRVRLDRHISTFTHL